jgi:hypothetical protein
MWVTYSPQDSVQRLLLCGCSHFLQGYPTGHFCFEHLYLNLHTLLSVKAKTKHQMMTMKAILSAIRILTSRMIKTKTMTLAPMATRTKVRPTSPPRYLLYNKLPPSVLHPQVGPTQVPPTQPRSQDKVQESFCMPMYPTFGILQALKKEKTMKMTWLCIMHITGTMTHNRLLQGVFGCMMSACGILISRSIPQRTRQTSLLSSRMSSRRKEFGAKSSLFRALKSIICSHT